MFFCKKNFVIFVLLPLKETAAIKMLFLRPLLLMFSNPQLNICLLILKEEVRHTHTHTHTERWRQRKREVEKVIDHPDQG